DGRRGIAERERGERREARRPFANHGREGVVDEASEAHGALRRLDVRARRREGDDLSIDAFSLDLLLAELDVAVAADGDVEVAGIVETGIAFGVDRQLDGTVAGL